MRKNGEGMVTQLIMRMKHEATQLCVNLQEFVLINTKEKKQDLFIPIATYGTAVVNDLKLVKQTTPTTTTTTT